MKGKLNIKILIIVLAVVVVAVVAGIFIVRSRAQSGEEVEKSDANKESFSVTLEDMYCNIKESKKILKIKLTVQTDDAEIQPIIQAKQFVIRDETNKIIRNNTEADLTGKEGMENLKRAIQRTLSNYFTDDTIVVFFDEFVIQ